MNNLTRAKVSSYFPTLLVCLLGLGATLWVAYFAANRFASDDKMRFEQISSKVKRDIVAQLAQYETVLIATRGLLLSSESVTRKEFHTFITGLGLREKFPGLQAVGFAPRITAPKLAKHIRDVRRRAMSDYSVWPSNKLALAHGEHFPLQYVEPDDPKNRKIIGFDIASEQMRFQTIANARDSGQAAMSHALILGQEDVKDVQNGFVMFLPIYDPRLPHATVPQRRAALRGFITSAFRARDFFNGLGHAQLIKDLHIDFEVFDGDQAFGSKLLYDADVSTNWVPSRRNGLLHETQTFVACSIPWTLATTALPGFSVQEARLVIGWITAGGIVITLLLAWLVTAARIHAANSRDNAIKLAAAVKARDELMSVCSHELRTPITSMKLQTQTMLRRIERRDTATITIERMKDFSEGWARQLERLNRLIEEMLEFSRLSAGKLRLRYEDVNLSEVLRETVTRLQPQAQEVHCEITTTIAESVHGKWDLFRIEQVITNVLGNAIKYGSSKPIDVSLAVEGPDAVIRVTDHGIGIPPDSLEKIFMPYERASSAESFSGLGLGLFITKEILSAHGATIAVKSEPGDGSTFIIRLPLDPPAELITPRKNGSDQPSARA